MNFYRIQIVDKVSQNCFLFENDLNNFVYDLSRLNRNAVIVETTSE
ncbi:hypothetical protein FM106_07455 [Brachybacterium faecium]|nr:hypothetical protein FM106_07455 [Brachybacterium faecium]